MTTKNTPGIKNAIPQNIPFVPEAHMYLMFNKHRLDFTRANCQALNDTMV